VTRVLVLAGGADWEAAFLTGSAAAGISVVARCVDVVDLMATATLGQAELAVVATQVPRFDADAVQHLLRHDVQVLVVGDPDQRERILRMGAHPVEGRLEAVVAAALDLAETTGPPAPGVATAAGGAPAPPAGRGRVVAVWGPTGAPGRTTVAIGIAAELAGSGRRTVLVDADPYGGSVAQQLGILDESSGLLAAARKVNAGLLDPGALAGSCRRLGAGLEVLTGLPRSDRRIEVRAEVLTDVLTTATELGSVVVDTGFSIEDERSDRDRMTLEALACADEIVVVGSADPVGLTRLARGLVDLGEVQPHTPVQVVVNRMRPSLGWNAAEVVGMVEGYVRPRGVHLVPDSREHLDRAVVAGRALTEQGDTAVRRSLTEVARACFPTLAQAPKRR